MPDFNDHDKVLTMISDAQESERDMRGEANDAKLFVTKKDGMWEPTWWHNNKDKPRYTFDMTNPVVKQIYGPIAAADFEITINPASGDATKEVAKLNDGMIRNIENLSGASHIYNHATKNVIICGIDGWRVNTKFVDDNSFDQDLVIERVPGFSDRVWLDSGAQEPDRKDAQWGVVMTGIMPEEYEALYPDGKQQSLDDGRGDTPYYHKPDTILVGELLYIKEEDRELVLMDNGQVYEVDDDYESVRDELAQAGVNESRRRTRKDKIVYSRMFDGGGFLTKERKTVFSWIPIIPMYANFDVYRDKTIFNGAVRPLMDYQRVFNYGKSREIEEGALAPRAKKWMSPKQVAGHEDTIATLNTNADPVQLFNPDPELPGIPGETGGASINPGLVSMTQSMQEGMVRAAGFVAPSMGEQVNNQSGVAIKALQDKGDIGTIEYFEAREIAQCHTARILIDAIPKVYDTDRQVRIIGRDGAVSTSRINQKVLDSESGQVVTLNDLGTGKYDVVCSAGPAFQNKQQETVAAITEIAAVDPSVITEGADILLNNVTAPGMDLLAERKRNQLFQAGLIPESQMTEEERAQLQEAEQQQDQAEQEPDALLVAAQAEMAKAEAEAQKNQIAFQKDQQDAAFKAAQQQLAIEKQQIELQEKQAKFALDQQKFELDAALRVQKQRMDAVTQALNDVKIDAETLKTLREAMGVDAVVGPHNMEAYIQQAQNVEQATESNDIVDIE